MDQDGRHIFEVESLELIGRPAMGCKSKKSGGEMPLHEIIKDRYRYGKVKVFDLRTRGWSCSLLRWVPI